MGSRKSGVDIVVVAEDQVTECFCRNALLKFGFNRHKIRSVPYPVGQGSGKDFVNRALAREVQSLRQKPHLKRVVVAVTDVDEMSIQQRIQRFAKAFEDLGMQDREPHERIVYWLPKWSIETWLHYLGGKTVDENTKYKNQVSRPDFRRIGQAFVDLYREQSTPSLPAMQFAFRETEQRLMQDGTH